MGIQFGVAGWRGMIGDDFTFGQVRAAAAAIARAGGAKWKHSKLLVAYDTRFLSGEFAQSAARAAESEGVRALLADRPAPVPAVSFAILHRKLGGGIYIGAGHDSSEYNGLKFFGPGGVAVGPQRASGIQRIATNLAAKEWDSEEGEAELSPVETVDLFPAYHSRIAGLVRFDAIRSSGISIAYDAMNGAGAGWMDKILAANAVPVHVLNGHRDVLFGGRAPDPIPENLNELADGVRKCKAALGLATDGDAGGFGILDRGGRFVSPAVISSLIYDYLVETRDWRPGGVEPVADLLGRDQVAAAVGQTGGLTIRGHVPESDGILACLLVAEMVAERGPLDAQVKELSCHAGAATATAGAKPD